MLIPRLVMPARPAVKKGFAHCDPHAAIGLELPTKAEERDTRIAFVFSPLSTGGMGLRDPATACATQDTRVLLAGLSSLDKRVAAATRAALAEGLNSDGTTKTDAHFETVLSRFSEIAGRGIFAHGGGGTTDILPPAAESKAVPEGACKRLKDEAQIAVVPATKVIWVPGAMSSFSDHKQGQQATSADGKLFFTSRGFGAGDLLAAVGMARKSQQLAVYALDLNFKSKEYHGCNTKTTRPPN
jgi:hypothetical protein